MKTYRFVLSLLLFVGMATSAARADTITITSGVISVGPGINSGGTATLIGDGGFTFTGSLGSSGNLGPKFCFPCTAGTSIPLVAQWGGLDLPGVAAFGGTTLDDLNGLNSPNGLLITLSGPSLTAPATTVSSLVLTAPVSLGGLFTHVPAGGGLAIQDSLAGSGVALLTLAPGGDPGLWEARSFQVALGPTAVTPEPASLLLLGTGLALVVRQLRRR